MIFLSSFLLAISINLIALKVSLDFKLKNIYLPKFSILLISIITSMGALMSMSLGKFFLIFFNSTIGNIFGGILLCFTGIYFISDSIRLQKKQTGYDTSYYFESELQYKNIIETPNIIDIDNSKHIDIKECIDLSIALIINGFCTTFSAGLTNININFSLFFYFIFSVLFLYLGSFNLKSTISTKLRKYLTLITGVILAILGIYEAFI